MEPALSALGLKVISPALRAGYNAVRYELARTGARGSYADVEEVVDEALAVLAGAADDLIGAIRSGAKALLSRPALFSEPVPRAWISTERAQTSLGMAARAALRGEDDSPYAADAMEQYRLVLEDGDETAPDAAEVYVEALGFVLVSIRRAMTPGERALLGAVHGVRQDLDDLRHEVVRRRVEPTVEDDARVRGAIGRLRARRFFRTADAGAEAASLVSDLMTGRLAEASASVRSSALAWCARLLSSSDREMARTTLTEAIRIGGDGSAEVAVAKAFIASFDDFEAGLRYLQPDRSRLEATAAFQILRNALGAEVAIGRADQAGLALPQLDGDGRLSLLTSLVETDRWAQARETALALDAADFEETPALLWIAGTSLVAFSLPGDMRPFVLQEIPPNPALFRLREDGAALRELRLARGLIRQTAEACRRLELDMVAAGAERYELWLGLRDPSGAADARKELRRRIDLPGQDLLYLPLALAFGLDVDRGRAESSLGRRIALGGADEPVVGLAAVALLLDRARADPVEAARFIERFRVVLANCLDAGSLLNVEVGVLTEAGRPEEARALLEAAGSTIPPEVRSSLASLIQGGADELSIESLEEAYAADPRTLTLEALVLRYRERDYEPRFLELATRLLSDLPSRATANRCLAYLLDKGQNREALSLLQVVGPMALENPSLALQAGWINYRMGQLSEAERALQIAEIAINDDQTRALRFNLLVTSGRWEELDPFLEEQWQARDSRSPLELVQCAGLAARTRSRRVADLIREAVARAPEDPEVLVAAYSAATTAGLEESIPEAGTWIMRAAERSGENGPVQSMSVQELLKDQPDWEARVEEAVRLWAAAEIPLIGVAAMLRQSWLDIQLTSMVGNHAEPKAADRRAVPLFSGRTHTGTSQGQKLKTVALDRHAVITLAFAGALDRVLESVNRVRVPHDLLSDLLEQRDRVAFHQPSKVAFAHRLLELLARGAVKRFEPSGVPDIGLVNEIGRSRAALLSEAARHGDSLHVVIHPFPITRVGSLLSEAVDLTRFSQHLGSCSAVIDALERMGQVPRPELEKARTYLAGHDRRWPEEPPIQAGATLYLTDLAVDYLRYLGLLNPISAAFKVIVSPSEINEAEALRGIEDRSVAVAAVVDTVRRTLAAGLRDGRVVLDVAVGSRREGFDNYPEETAALASDVEILVSDDRFLNQHRSFEGSTGKCALMGSLEFLERLSSSTSTDVFWMDDVRTRLRLAGVTLIGTDAEELSRFLSAVPAEGEFRETAELRAVRESLRVAQRRAWFNPPLDAQWLVRLQNAAAGALIWLWDADPAHEQVRKRSTWLFLLMNSRDWSQSDVGTPMEAIARDGLVLDLAKLVSLFGRMAPAGRSAFSQWLEQDVLDPLWNREPRFREALVAHLRSLVRSVAEQLSASRAGLNLRTAMRAGLSELPDFLQIEILKDEAFRAALSIDLDATLTVGEASFRRSGLWQAAASIYAKPGASRRLVDQTGRRWTLRTERADGAWILLLYLGKLRYRIRGLAGLHPEPSERVAMLDAQLAELGHLPSILEDWRERLGREQLDVSGTEALNLELLSVPGAVAAAISESLGDGEASIELLVPCSRHYYERLVGADVPADLEEYVASGVPRHIEHVRVWYASSDEWLLLIASHPRLLAGGAFGDRTPSEWLRLAGWAISDGDLVSKVAFVELALAQATAVPQIGKLIHQLVDQIEALSADDQEGSLHLLASVSLFVDGELSRSGVLSDWPPFRRRQAALAHAAVICRILSGAFETGRFARFCTDQRGWRFLLQNLVDLRHEPRWRPDFLSASQLRNELVGRLVNAAADAGDSLPEDLRDRMLGDGGLKSKMDFPAVFWPGPLEGGATLQSIPEHLAADLDREFAAEAVGSGALVLLANVAVMFEIPGELAGRCAERIAAAGADLLHALPSDEVYAHVLALAHVAASHRLAKLADTVRVLARVHRQHSRFAVAEELQLALVSAASHAEHADWRKVLGDWMRELAAQTNDSAEAEVMLGWLEALCEIDPLLRLSLGSPIAMLRLLLGR